MAGVLPDETLGNDYEKVDSEQPHVGVDPQTVNVTTNNIYARHYKVYNIDAHHVQVYNSEKTDSGTNSSLSFNSLHGSEIRLEKQNTIATRIKGYKNGICFASKHFDKDTPVHFQIKDTFEGAYGRCRMGFTNRDPSVFEGSGILQKGVENARYSDGFVIIEPSMDTCSYPGAVVYFSYSDGSVTFRSSKDGATQTFPCSNVFHEDDDLWAFIELRGPVKTVEVENNDFHEVCGSLTQVQHNTASQGWMYSMGWHGGLVAFTKTPVAQRKHVEFKLSQVYMISAGHIRVGVCKENPDLVRPENLPDTILRNSQYVTMEIGADDSQSGNIISLVPIESQICVVVNNEKQIGVFNLDKNVDKTWAVVELFGKTKAVEILTRSPYSDPQFGRSSERHLEREKDPTIDQLLTLVADLWLESQVLMNTLKALADAVVYHLDSCNPGAYWNSVVNTVETASSFLGLGGYVQMAEIGDAPEILRSYGPTLAQSVRQFVSNIDEIKIAVGKIKSAKIRPRQSKQFKLLRSIAAALPQFHVHMPRRSPSSPPPPPLLLNLSPLPVHTDSLQCWYERVVVRTLLETANKIEAGLVPLDDKMRQLYKLGIGHSYSSI